jgi:hypothetical protein
VNDRRNSKVLDESKNTRKMSNVSRMNMMTDKTAPRPSMASIKAYRPSLSLEYPTNRYPPLMSRSLSDIIGRLNTLIVLVVVLVVVMISGGSYIAWKTTTLLKHVTQDDDVLYPADVRGGQLQSPLDPSS